MKNQPISIELEFYPNTSKTDIEKIRQFLKSEIPDFDLKYREHPPIEGTMGDGFYSLLLYGVTVATTEMLTHATLESVSASIIRKIKNTRDRFLKENNLKTLDIKGSVRFDSNKTVFKIESDSVRTHNTTMYSLVPDKTYAVLIGCGEFIDKKIHSIPPVEGNVEDFLNILIDKDHFAIPPENIIVSLNETSDQITHKLYKTSRTPGIHTFLFYYCGHGFCSDKESYSLAGTNTEKIDGFINAGIDKNFIQQTLLADSPAHQKIAIIDACYSGILTLGLNELFQEEVRGNYILTSSSAKEASFYDRHERHTYFTDAMLRTICEGIDKEEDTFSLDDLYVGICEKMRKRDLQTPSFKNGLNIETHNFILSPNAAFTVEKERERLNRFKNKNDDEKTIAEFRRMIAKHPNDEHLKEEAKDFIQDSKYRNNVNQGDEFYHSRNYKQALKFYKRALKTKDERLVRDRYNECIAKTLNGFGTDEKTLNTISPIPVANETKRKNKWKKILTSFICLFVAAIAGHFVKEAISESNPTSHNIAPFTARDSIGLIEVTNTKVSYYILYLSGSDWKLKKSLNKYHEEFDNKGSISQMELAVDGAAEEIGNRNMQKKKTYLLLNGKSLDSTFVAKIKSSPSYRVLDKSNIRDILPPKFCDSILIQ